MWFQLFFCEDLLLFSVYIVLNQTKHDIGRHLLGLREIVMGIFHYTV